MYGIEFDAMTEGMAENMGLLFVGKHARVETLWITDGARKIV